MKLLAELKKMIGQMDGIKRAWFTTFNLNLSFVERYILPALISQEEVPRTARDFEMIMQIIHEKNMDVRFFCDGRMLEMDEGKKTTVDVHPLNITRFDSRFHEGVFHPKVILLQDMQDKTIIFCGSANLTIGGWAHNREGVICREIQSQTNAEKVRQFFERIFETVYGERFPDEFTIAADTDEENWQFSSTLTDKEPFLSLILKGDVKELVVWSPYFAMDVPKFVSNHFQNIKAHIIPDVQGRKVRIRKDPANQEAFATPDLSLKQYGYTDQRQEERMTHAKIWLTGSHLAVGSWNMTEAGIGGNSNANNNIEAGLILEVGRKCQTEVLQKCEALECKFMPEEELDKEKPDLISDDFASSLKVMLDWDKRKYFIDFEEQTDNETLVLKLPDQERPFHAGEYPIKEEKLDNLLQNHTYTVEKDGETVHCGFIKEINCGGRPAWKYGNLTELLFDYITKTKTRTGTGNHRLTYRASSAELEDPPEEFLQAEAISGGISYFGMFQAFAGIRGRIEKAMGTYENDPAELTRLMRGYPGSVYELSEKIEKACAEDLDNKTMSPVFKWFLQQEYNAIIELVKNFAEKKTEDEGLKDLAKELDQKYLRPELNLPEAQEYLAAVERRCGYAGK